MGVLLRTAIFVLASAWLLHIKATATSSNRHAHFLTTVFGNQHLAQLGLSAVDLDTMLHAEGEQRGAQVPTQTVQTCLACGGLSTKDAIVAVLRRTVGIENFDSVYSSRRQNIACWVVRADQKQVNNLSQNQFIQSVAAIPRELKLHPSVLKLFSAPESKAGSDRNSGLLKIEFGLGTGRGMHDIDIWKAVTSWLQRNAQVQSKAHGRWKQLRKRHGRDSVRKHCDYSQLQLSSTKFTAHLRGLGSILASEHGMGCLHTLIDHAIGDARVVRVLWTPELRAMNNDARGIIQSGTAGDEPFTEIGLTGGGEIVGVADSGLDDLSCFFIDSSGTPTPRSSIFNPKAFPDRRKVIQYIAFADETDTADGHGTHVCGSVAGQDGDNEFNGMAQDAKLAFFDIGRGDSSSLTVPDLQEVVFPIAADAGAHIHSDSWGSTFQGCDEFCLQIDTFTYENDDFLVVFAAGNAGEFGYFSVGNPSMSKNCLTVGASEVRDDNNPFFNQDYIAFFSGIGPTFDNRIKPEVVAPGYFIDSARAAAFDRESCAVIAMAGTSMATPITSGGAALVRQYFRDDQFWASVCNQHYPSCGAFNCSAPLVKAVLINSAAQMERYDAGGNPTILPSQDLGTPPDYFQGFGRILLANTLPIPDDPAFDLFVLDRASLSSDETIKFEVHIQDDSQPLRVTMSWYDPPTASFTSKQVLHDLDLLVVSPNGTRYWGNRVENGDERNNNERVVVDNVESGTYTVLVHAYPLVAADTQEFAIAITSRGRVDGPTDGADDFPDVSKECTDNEVLVNMIDLKGDGWGLGIFMYITDADDQIVFLGITVAEFNSTSACLPRGCYTAFLQLDQPSVHDQASSSKPEKQHHRTGKNATPKVNRLGNHRTNAAVRLNAESDADSQEAYYYGYYYGYYGYYYSGPQTDDVVAEISSCTFLLFSGEDSFDFCVDNGECDYCDGDTDFRIEWEDVSGDSRSQALWVLFDFSDPESGEVGEELYGGSALDGGSRRVCLDDGTYILSVPTAPSDAAANMPACDLSLHDGELACIEIKDGNCTAFNDNCPSFIDCPIPTDEAAVDADATETMTSNTRRSQSRSALDAFSSRGLCSDTEPTAPSEDQGIAFRAPHNPDTLRVDLFVIVFVNLALAYVL